jgi:hypothetical protein
VTDLLDQNLVDAVLTLLTNDTGLTVFDGVVPTPTPPRPYVLVYTHLDRPSEDPDNALNGKSGVWVPRFICHCVGNTAAAARGVAERVRTQLLDVRPVVAGLATGLLRLEQSLPPARDESTGVLVMDAVVVYRLRATS